MPEDFVPELWRRAIEMQIDALHLRMTDIEARMDANQVKLANIDANTSEVARVFRDFKGARRTLKFTATFLAPVGVIATAITAVFGLGKVFGIF